MEGNTGVANICRDRQGGWWMVMGHLGVFYTHPSRYRFEVGTAQELGIPDSKLDESHRRVKALWQYHQQPDNDIVTDSHGRKWRATVTETSDACGFSSISYFSRAFTKEFGVSPSEYERGKS